MPQRMRQGGTASRMGVLVVLLLAATARDGLAARRAHRLSTDGLAGSDVGTAPGPRVSPDGEWVVYVHDVDTVGAPELFAVRRWGGAPVRLSALLPLGSRVHEFAITADSRRVVYVADQEAVGRDEAYSVPIGGPAGASIKVSPQPDPGEQVSSCLLVDGDRHVVTEMCGSTVCTAVWSAPVDGSSPPVRLSPALAADRDVQRTWIDAQRVLFTTDELVLGQYDLWSVPADGSAPPVRLDPAPVANGSVEGMRLSPDQTRALYRADELVPGRYELFSVPAGGPAAAAIKISGTLVAGGNVQAGSYGFSPDGQWVVYLADQNTVGKIELFAAPADGSAPAHQLNSALIAAGDVSSFAIDRASQRVLYIADAFVDQQTEVFSVPIGGPAAAAVRLNPPLPAGAHAGGAVMGDAGNHAILFGDLAVLGRMEMWAAPLDGSSPAYSISDPITSGGNVIGAAPADADFSHVVLLGDLAIDDSYQLYSTPIDGSSTRIPLGTGITVVGADVTSMTTYPLHHEVVFREDRSLDGQFNLYATDALLSCPPTMLNPAGVAGSNILETAPGQPTYFFTPDGAGIVFLADLLVDEKVDLWIADDMMFRSDFEEGDTSEWTAAHP